MALTDLELRNLKPTDRVYEVTDGQALSVRVSRTGLRTFQYRYRLHGKPERLKLGVYPQLSLADARRALQDARRQVMQGVSPAYRRQVQRATQQAEAGAETVQDLANEFMQRFVERERKHPEDVRQMLKADVLPNIGPLRAKDITRRHIIALTDRIVDRGARVHANRTASMLKQMFQYAVERGMIESNPCADIRRRTVGGTETPRDRNLGPDEIRSFWTWIEPTADLKRGKQLGIGMPLAVALKLLLVTAQRRGELNKARWEQVDLGASVWTIPAANSKNGKEHRVPLSTLAVELFGRLKALSRESEWVLPGAKGAGPIRDRAITKAAERAQQTVGIPHWVPHDLRRTAATQIAELGHPPHVVEKVLNHTLQGVQAVYNRHDYSAEKRAALDSWATRLRAIIDPSYNVVPLPVLRTA
jgi:integrase